MKIKTSYLSCLSLGAGAAALLVRQWYLAEGVEQGGLLSAGHPGNMIGYILLALVPLMLLVAVWPMLRKNGGSVYFAPGITGCAGNMIAAAGVLVACIPEIIKHTGILTLISGFVGILAAICFVVEGLRRLKGNKPNDYLHCAIAAYFIVALLSQYRKWSIEPQLQLYLPQLLAFVFLMFTVYQHVALAMGMGKPGQYLFFNYGAVFFCMVAISGEMPVFFLTMALWTLLAGKPAKVETEAPMNLPENVLRCIEALEKNGYTAYVVGGCVRDHLLGRKPHDYDLCTNAKPEDICRIFEKYTLVRAGEKHGTIGVVMGNTVYEITTYRTEGAYSDNRHPDQVSFVDNIREDLSRRDFTVNAISYSPTRGYEDPFGGMQDLKGKILRAVGDPQMRFREDALRILRGVRFAVRFRLTPEESTEQAMFALKELMENLAAERIFTELCGMLPYMKAEDLLHYAPVITQVIPELKHCVDFAQHNPHHSFDVYTHIAKAVEAVPAETALRLAALLHDVGKPQCYTEDESGCGHFYGHAHISARMAEEILARLKAPTALREQVVFLVENHMDLFEADRKTMLRRLSKWGEERTKALMTLQKADFAATGEPAEAVDEAYLCREAMLESLLQEGKCLTLKALAIDGNDLMEMGMEAGPQIGKCLNALLELVLEEALPNEKEALLEAAKAYMK